MLNFQLPLSTSLDPFIKLIRNIEELENEWRKVPNVDYTLQLPVHIYLNSSYLTLLESNISYYK